MKSKTKINKQANRKTSSVLKSVVLDLKKSKSAFWVKTAALLTRPKRTSVRVSLDKINKKSSPGDKVVIPGKVLSQGNLTKKIEVIAFSFSSLAKEKIKKDGFLLKTIEEELKSNPEANKLKLIY